MDDQLKQALNRNKLKFKAEFKTGMFPNEYNYDILTNPEYQRKFGYVPTKMKDRASYIATPDYCEDGGKIERC